MKAYPKREEKYVRCVRCNEAYGTNLFSFNDAETTVIDKATGLEWTRAQSGNTGTEDADVTLTISKEGGAYSDSKTQTDFITVSEDTLINNPGLESGVSGDWVGSGNFQITNEDPHSGNYCMEIWNEGSNYEQHVSGLAPNTEYTLSAYGKGRGTRLIAYGYNGSDEV